MTPNYTHQPVSDYGLRCNVEWLARAVFEAERPGDWPTWDDYVGAFGSAGIAPWRRKAERIAREYATQPVPQGEPTPTHGYTCGWCDWGRGVIGSRTEDEYRNHISATGHYGDRPYPAEPSAEGEARSVPICPACRHREHDPGACEFCPRCELHTDDALEWVIRIHPELLAEYGFARAQPADALGDLGESPDYGRGWSDCAELVRINAALKEDKS